ncbi:Telomerase reverse transcriptase, partial [Coemansia erecta]
MSNILFSASFACVSTLGEFMDALVIGGQCIRSDDSADFKRFLETTLVGHRKIKSRLAFHEPVEKLADTAVKVIKWILQSESKGTESGGYRNQKPFKRNMLALGYDMCKDGSTNCVKGVRELSSQCINSSMIELAKHRWAALLDRTGTSAMMYLLQKTSVFVPLCNASYNQICGVPFVKMEAPPPDIMPVPGISTIISPDTQRKRRGARIRTQPKRRKLCTIENLSRTASSISDTSGSLADAIGEDASTGANDIRPSLASIVIDRGRMLYNTPRLAQHKVVWDLLADFPLNRCKTADNLLEQIFVLMPDAAAEPPEALRTLCKRMLKLYKKFQFRFHLFRKCPAPWQVKDSGFNPSTFTATFSDNPFDSDDEEIGVDGCNGRIPFGNKHPATAARPAFNSSDNTLSQLLLLQTPTPLDSDASTYSQVIGDGRCVPQAATGGKIGKDDAVGAVSKTKKAKRGAKNGSSQSGKATNGAGDRGGDGHVQPNVVDMANTHSQVHSFLQLCIASVVPRDLIGGRGNHRRLYKVLHELVFLGRHDGLRLGPAMHGFKLCEATAWLDPRERNAASMYACVVHWLISQYALQLVRCFFYVTEASLHGSKLFYFRKDVWNTVTRDAWKSLVSDMFSPKPLSQAVLESEKRQTFGHSRIRLMPKKHGFRAIANLGQSFVMKQVPRTTKARCYPRNGYKEIHIPSTNRVLSNALAALNYVRKSYPELFGSAVFGFADIHAKLGKFKAAIHTLRGEHMDLPRFYIAKVDIRRAFDTIPQRKLLSLLQEKLPDEEYSVSKYWTVSPSFG